MQPLNSYRIPKSFLLLGLFLVSPFGIFAQNDNHMASVVLSDYERADLKKVIVILEEADGITFTELIEPVVYFIYDTEANRVAAMEQLYHRTFGVSGKNGRPLTYPLLPDNPTSQEQQDYNEQKASWIEANPAEYEAMQQLQEPTVISQEDFDNLPENKQQYILDHPDQFIVE